MKIKEFIKIDELEDDQVQVRGQFVIPDDSSVQKEIDKILKGGKD